MQILFAASEMVPFCKTGGLADVIGALPPLLAEAGHDVHVILPGYSAIDRGRFGFGAVGIDFPVPVNARPVDAALSKTVWKGVNVHLLENEGYYGRKNLYGTEHGDYPDNAERFVFYARGVVEAARHIGIEPDIVHAHDWQAGLVMTYLKTLHRADPVFKKAGTLFTIHNLGYQGLFSVGEFMTTGLPWEEFHWSKLEYWGNVSFLKGGIVFADAVSTVSESYAREITGEEMGFGMHGVLQGRAADLHGIVNGIDTDEWDPAADTAIPAVFRRGAMAGKKTCRRELLSASGLDDADSRTPVIGMVTRLDDQKGLDILEGAVTRLMALDIRLVVLGAGTEHHHRTMTALARRFPGSVSVNLRFDNDMAKRIYAGSDAFLMPSRYEPCGLGQLIAMRYGTLPIVHATGGLRDTVDDLDRSPETGTGFSFEEYSSEALTNAVTRAAAVFREKGKRRWNGAVRRAMARDSSWRASAERYIGLYRRLRNRTAPKTFNE